MSKSYEAIEVSQHGKLGLIALNRPKVLNAINRSMVSEILDLRLTAALRLSYYAAMAEHLLPEQILMRWQTTRQ
jgi:enoyl-CoA hydratase/carnithine racemase